MDSSVLTLSELTRAIARSWRLLAAGAAAGVLCGIAVHVALPQSYTATTAIRVDPTGVDPLTTAPPTVVDLATEERVATSRPIAGSLDVDAHAIDESAVLEISCTSHSPTSAAQGSRRVATAYLADRQRRASARADELRRQIEHQISSAPDDLPTSALTGLRTDLERSRRLRTVGGEVIDRAGVPERGNRPGRALTMSAGGLLGLLGMMPFAALGSRSRSELVVVDAPGAEALPVREGMASLADHVLVVRRTASELDIAERWCQRLRAVGIPATVVSSGADVTRSEADRAS